MRFILNIWEKRISSMYRKILSSAKTPQIIVIVKSTKTCMGFPKPRVKSFSIMRLNCGNKTAKKSTLTNAAMNAKIKDSEINCVTKENRTLFCNLIDKEYSLFTSDFPYTCGVTCCSHFIRYWGPYWCFAFKITPTVEQYL